MSAWTKERGKEELERRSEEGYRPPSCWAGGAGERAGEEQQPGGHRLGAFWVLSRARFPPFLSAALSHAGVASPQRARPSLRLSLPSGRLNYTFPGRRVSSLVKLSVWEVSLGGELRTIDKALNP